MAHSSRSVVYCVAPGVSGLVLALTGAPWWLAGLAFACLALGFVLAGVQSVFPQDSEHRLAWWRSRWSRRMRRQ